MVYSYGLRMTRWIDPDPVDVSPDLHAAVGGHPLLAEILVRRGFSSVDAALGFLDPRAYRPADPHDLPGLATAAERIELAVRRGERTAIYGDFDADGQTATALLLELFGALEAGVLARVPSRERGHGMQPSDVDDLVSHDVRLIVTCDTGVTAYEAIDRAQAKGVDVIVTDHHVPGDALPAAVAVVNPHRLLPGHPMATLSGVAVAYQLARVLRPRQAEQALDLVAIGLLADIAALTGDTRFLVQRGLELLRHTPRMGLKAMYEAAEIRAEGIGEEHVGFVLAPRLNALGRLADANLGVELLTTRDAARARILAVEIEGLNARRQWLTKQIMDAALADIEHAPSLLAGYSALVLSRSSWPSGVTGIVAGRLAERFGRPAVLITTAPDGRSSGSGRSVPGIDLVSALKECSPLLLRYGGHAGAAGFLIDTERIPEFRAALSRAVDNQAIGAPERTRQIDAWVGLPDLTLDLVASASRLAPFGPGNPLVTLAVRDLRITAEAVTGRTAEHRKLVVEDPSGTSQTVFWWHGAGLELPSSGFDLALSVRASDYRGQTELQVEWIEARVRDPEAAATASGPVLSVTDMRFVTNPATELRRICTEPAVQVWAEGRSTAKLPSDLARWGEGIGVGGRHQLMPSRRLALWSPPPGPVELLSVLGRVRPEMVFAFFVDPDLAEPQPLLKHLAGICKFALRERSGSVDLEAAAAAAAHRRGTIRAGIDLLAAQGKFVVLDRGPSVWRIAAGGGDASPGRAQDSAALLSGLLDETAAYRSHLRSLPGEALAAYFIEAAAGGDRQAG